MGLSGFLTESLGWPSVFYIFGALTAVIAIFWFILCADSPDVHPWISTEERDFIVDAIGVRNAPPQKKDLFKITMFKRHFIFGYGYNY